MNNSVIAFNDVQEVDNTLLREEESRLVKIIEAITKINKLDDWSTLKSLVFDSRIESIEKKISNESSKLKIEDSELYRLQGRLFEAKKYDLDKLLDTYRLELSRIRKLTQPTER